MLTVCRWGRNPKCPVKGPQLQPLVDFYLSASLLQRRQWQTTPVLLPGKSHGQGSLVGCSPWGREESLRLSDFIFTFHFHALEKEMATHSSALAWRIPGTGPGGLPSMGSHRVGHDWSDLAAAAAASLLMGLTFFWLCPEACGILVLQPEMESKPPAVEAWSLNHWTPGESLMGLTFCLFCFLLT